MSFFFNDELNVNGTTIDRPEIAVSQVTGSTVSASKAVVDSNKDYYDSKTTTKPTGLSSMKAFNKLVLSQLNEVVTTIQVDIDGLTGPNTLQSHIMMVQHKILIFIVFSIII